MPPKSLKPLLLALPVFLVCYAAAEPFAGNLLDEIIARPGGWNQMCSGGPLIPADVPLPLYSLAAPRTFPLSQNNIARVRARRAEVASEITARLKKIYFFVPSVRPEDLSSETYSRLAATPEGRLALWDNQAYGTNRLTGVVLQIVLESKAVEALPELLRLEADLNQRLENVAKDNGITLPDLEFYAEASFSGLDFQSKSYPREHRLVVARIYQRELLSVMAALLRDRHFQPILDSEVEKHYLESLKGTASPKFMPYTPKLRQQILQFVQDYLKLPPVAQSHGPGASASAK